MSSDAFLMGVGVAGAMIGKNWSDMLGCEVKALAAIFVVYFLIDGSLFFSLVMLYFSLF